METRRSFESKRQRLYQHPQSHEALVLCTSMAVTPSDYCVLQSVVPSNLSHINGSQEATLSFDCGKLVVCRDTIPPDHVS